MRNEWDNLFEYIEQHESDPVPESVEPQFQFSQRMNINNLPQAVLLKYTGDRWVRVNE